jgi:hypothetical protein
MSKQGIGGTPTRPTEDSSPASGEVVKTNRRNVTLSNIDTASMTSDLKVLFDKVMLGMEYDEGQVKHATNLTGTIIKVLRFEFEIYKHFIANTPGRAGRPPAAQEAPREDTIAVVASYLRKLGDKVEKGAGVLWVINDRSCEEKDLITRANNLRRQRGERPFVIVMD